MKREYQGLGGMAAGDLVLASPSNLDSLPAF